MKKYVVMDILDIIFIPLITYLLSGLLVIQLCNFTVDATSFVVWGVMAGIALAIQKYFSNRAVTAGIVVYALLMVSWFTFYVQPAGVGHAILIGLSFVVILLFRLLMQSRPVKISIGFGLMAVMIYFAIFDVEFSRTLIVFAIILFLNAVSEAIAIFSAGNVKSLVVIYVMVAVVTLIMPVSDKPYGWDFVFKIIEAIETVVETIVAEINYQFADVKFDGIFRFQSTGYSDDAINLSEGLVEQDVDQLLIQGDKTKRHMYLKGNVCNEYTGNSWETNLSGEVLDYRVDALMTLYAIFQETEDYTELRKFMEIEEQKINFLNLKTQSLFYPVKLLGISVEDVIGVGDTLRAPQINGRGYSYSYYFVDIDYTNEIVVEILKNSSHIEYEEEAYNRVYEILNEFYGIEIEKIPFDEFCQVVKSSEEMAKEQYLSVGEHVSGDVKELAAELNADCQNDYEISKKIEKYLYQYHYNMAVQVPENVNVLDWFLFEGKEGYCAHYATALAVMLRTSGIPSRIAEGFLVDYKDYQDSYTFKVSSKTAHAWVEAYIEGFGWIRLEPTVVNAGNANLLWYGQAVEDEEIIEEESSEVIATPKEDEGQKMSWMMMIKLLGGMIVLVAVILAGVVIYRRILIRNSNNPDVVFKHMLSVLERKYFVRNPSETLSEYFARLEVEEDFPKEVKGELKTIRDVMEMYWYGRGSVSEEVIMAMKTVGSIN